MSELALPLGISSENILGFGTSGVAALYPETRIVVKFPHETEEDDDLGTRLRCKREKDAYERLAPSANRPGSILMYFGPSIDGRGILLEYAEYGRVDEYITKNNRPPSNIILRWAQQAAEALVHCHSKHVLHGDIRCGNFLLDRKLNLKLSDFTGSSIDSSGSLSYYNTDYLLPESAEYPKTADGAFAINPATEVFAFGSALYEMSTGKRPHLHNSNSGKKSFPDVTNVGMLGPVIHGCWTLEFDTMAAVLQRIEDIKGMFWFITNYFTNPLIQL